MPNAAEKARLAREAKERAAQERREAKQRAQQERRHSVEQGRNTKRRQAEQRRQERENRSYRNGPAFRIYLFIFIIALIATLGSGVMLIICRNDYSVDLFVTLGKILFYVGIALCVFTGICAIVAFIQAPNGSSRRENSFITLGVLQSAATIFLIVSVILYNNSGKRDYIGYYNEEQTGLRYALRDSGLSTIVAYNGSGSELTLAKEAQGQEVEYINDSVFAGDSRITSVTIPGATSIGPRAFENCRNLQTVTFSGQGQTHTLWQFAFNECSSLRDVYLGSSALKLGLNQWDVGSPFNKTNQVMFHASGATIGRDFNFGTNSSLMISGEGTNIVTEHVFQSLVLESGFNFRGTSLSSYTIWFGDHYHPLARDYYIPRSVTEIPERFFGDSIKDGENYSKINIYYEGSSSEWSNVRKREDNNGILKDSSKYSVFPNSTYHGN